MRVCLSNPLFYPFTLVDDLLESPQCHISEFVVGLFVIGLRSRESHNKATTEAFDILTNMLPKCAARGILRVEYDNKNDWSEV